VSEIKLLRRILDLRKKEVTEDAGKLLKVTSINFRLIIMPISQRV
jgi:hypothetical protein